MLRRAHAAFVRFSTSADRASLDAFVEREASWAPDYALFAALKESHGGAGWTAWEPKLRRRDARAVREAKRAHGKELDFQLFAQWLFDTQWRALRAAAHKRGIGLLGDVPIFVAHDSADVWAHQELFFLDDATGLPTVVAGVPPDYFSETGQRWGNALYRWDVEAKSGFAWWRARMHTSAARFDAVRLDHFIGFSRYWEIPADKEDARIGVFRPGPGRALFDALFREMPDLQLIAEDLGVITDEVKALRDGLDIPGMRVLQFAFGADPGSRAFQPHAFPHRCVVYTATHDNDTTVGWLTDPITKTDAAARAQRELMLRYAGSVGREPHWDLIRLAMSSVADTCIVPMQDVLGLGSEARMNTPATAEGNWSWRLRLADIPHFAVTRLATMADTYARAALVPK
jgi:4-alpha-glucanotransferase